MTTVDLKLDSLAPLTRVMLRKNAPMKTELPPQFLD